MGRKFGSGRTTQAPVLLFPHLFRHACHPPSATLLPYAMPAFRNLQRYRLSMAVPLKPTTALRHGRISITLESKHVQEPNSTPSNEVSNFSDLQDEMKDQIVDHLDLPIAIRKGN